MIRQSTLLALLAANTEKSEAVKRYEAARRAVLVEAAKGGRKVEPGEMGVEIKDRVSKHVTMADVKKVLGADAAALLEASIKPRTSTYVTLTYSDTGKPVFEHKPPKGKT
jgi:hypothetical protein